LQSPPLGEVFSDGTDPSVNPRIADWHRHGVEAILLRSFIAVVEIELVGEFVERQGEISGPRVRDLCNLGQCLWAGQGDLLQRPDFDRIACTISLSRSSAAAGSSRSGK
jgi:hypothetical protein